ncbi:MAG TPA: hypothetical protein VGY55_09235 [Pirellulales bacterium]|nr:hypothetical protein [Pirellulales bacterium]
MAVRVHQVAGVWFFDLDPNATPLDADYYAIDLQFHRGSDSVHYIIDDLGGGNPKLAAEAQGDITVGPGETLTPGQGIVIELNDPGISKIPGLTNQVELEDVNSGGNTGGLNTRPQDETFSMSVWKEAGLGVIGPVAEYDPFPSGNTNGIPDSNTQTPNLQVLWETFNTSKIAQTLFVADHTTDGGDRIAVQATDGPNPVTLDPGVSTFLTGGVFHYPGEFQAPVPVSRGDEFDISSDSAVNDGPNFIGNTNGITGPLTIEQGAGQNTVIISDKGDTTLTMPPTVTLSSAPGLAPPEIDGTITGISPAPISYFNPVAPDPFNLPVPISSVSLELVGADAMPTTFDVTGTIENASIVGHKDPANNPWLNTLTLDGGAVGGNVFNIQAATVNKLTINSTTLDSINIASDAPTNAGNTAGIGAATAITVNTSGLGNTLAISDQSGANPDNVTLTSSQISGFSTTTSTTPAGFTTILPISYTEAAGGGGLAFVLRGPDTQPTVFNVASTLPLDTVILNGGPIGGNVFNIQTAAGLSVTANTGDGNGDIVNVTSTLGSLGGNLDGIAAQVTANFGIGTGDILNVSDEGGLASSTTADVTLSNTLVGAVTYNFIRGFTPPYIAYSEGGTLAVNIYTSNSQPTDVSVASTLGAGTTLSLTGGAGGDNAFNLLSATADSVTINTGNGGLNAVTISDSAPGVSGTTAGISATTAVTVNTGSGADKLVVSDAGGAAGDAVTLTNAQISGFTTIPIAYTAVLSGKLEIDLDGSNASGDTFNVPNTLALGLGNSVSLTGGLAGGNAFNLGSTAAANNGQLSLLGATITVNGGGGIGNNLEINDHGSTGAFNYQVGSSSVKTDISSPRPFGGVTFSNVQTMQLDATEKRNLFTVAPSATTVYTINGYGPTATGAPGGNVPANAGDQITLVPAGTQNFVLTKTAVPAGGNSYNGNWTFSNRDPINFTNIESLPIPNAGPSVSNPILVEGADASVSGQPLVKVLFAANGQSVDPAHPNGFLAYETTYHGGVRVAVGYFDNTGQQEIAVAPGAGHSPTVKVFDLFGNMLFQFQAYASTMTNGINIAAGNIEGTAAGKTELDDIVTVPARGVSEVRVWHDQFPTVPAVPVTMYRDFTVFGTGFIGGSTVAVADLNLDGRGDVIVGSGSGMQSLIETFDVKLAASSYNPFRIFYPFDASYRGGVNVSAISVGPGVTVPEVIASQANAGSPMVRIFNGVNGIVTNTFTPYAGSGSNTAVRTVAKSVGGHLYVYTAQSTHGQSNTIRQYDPSTNAIIDFILESDPNFLGIYLG